MRVASPCVVVMLGTFLTATVIAGAQAPRAGAPGAPLTLTATCGAQGETPTVRARIANTGTAPATLVVGFIAPDRRTHVVTSLAVVAIRPATGADESYTYVNPKFALASGPAWTVTLAPGASHDIELPLKDFISTMSYAPLDPGTASGARLVLEGKAAGRGAAAWTGTIETVLPPCRVVWLVPDRRIEHAVNEHVG